MEGNVYLKNSSEFFWFISSDKAVLLDIRADYESYN